MSDYPMLISNKLHSFRNFILQIYTGNSQQYLIIRRKLELKAQFCHLYFANLKKSTIFATRKTKNRNGSILSHTRLPC